MKTIKVDTAKVRHILRLTFRTFACENSTDFSPKFERRPVAGTGQIGSAGQIDHGVNRGEASGGAAAMATLESWVEENRGDGLSQ